MSGESETEVPHGSAQECAECGETVYTDAGRCNEHFRVEYVSRLDRHADHGVLCSTECLRRWADAR